MVTLFLDPDLELSAAWASLLMVSLEAHVVRPRYPGGELLGSLCV